MKAYRIYSFLFDLKEISVVSFCASIDFTCVFQSDFFEIRYGI